MWLVSFLVELSWLSWIVFIVLLDEYAEIQCELKSIC